MSVTISGTTGLSNVPAGSIAATNTQAAINELDTEKAALAGSASQTFSASTLNVAAGTVSAPSLTLSTDTTTGLYRIGANNDGYAVSGAKVLDIGSTGLAVTGTVTVNGATTTTYGSTALACTVATPVILISNMTAGKYEVFCHLAAGSVDTYIASATVVVNPFAYARIIADNGATLTLTLSGTPGTSQSLQATSSATGNLRWFAQQTYL